MPNMSSSLEIIKNPFISPSLPEDGQYIFSSWLYHFLAYALGANTQIKLFALGFIFASLFFFISLNEIRQQVGDKFLLSAGVFFILLPASFTAFFWVGMDGLTLLLMMLAIRSRARKHASVFFGVCLGLQHFEQGAVAFTILLVASALLKRKNEAIMSLRIFSSIIAGKILLDAVLFSLNIQHKGRALWLADHFSELTLSTFLNFPQVLWSLFGFGWLIIFAVVQRTKINIVYSIPVVLVLLLAFISADQTRTMAIASFPFILRLIILNEDFYANVPKVEFRKLAFLVVLSPIVWVWSGDTYSTLIFHDFGFLLGRFFGLFPIPEDPALWPFK